MRRQGRRRRMLGQGSIPMFNTARGWGHAPPSTGVDPARGSGIFSFFSINWAYMPVISTVIYGRGGRIQRVYTLLAVADGNSGFVLAQAIVVLPACLRLVRSADGDHNMYLPGSPKMRERTLPRTGSNRDNSVSRHLHLLLVNSHPSSAVPQECRQSGWR